MEIKYYIFFAFEFTFLGIWAWALISNRRKVNRRDKEFWAKYNENKRLIEKNRAMLKTLKHSNNESR